MPARSFIAAAGITLAALLSSSADPVKAPAFAEYALDPGLSREEALTVDLMIDAVRAEHDKSYWDDWQERDEAREVKNYKPSFTKEQVALAETHLPGKDWLSVQMASERNPVRDLTPLRYMSSLEGLSAGKNEITDLKPLGALTKLSRLLLDDNKVSDLSPLAACTALREFSITGNPVQDFSPLAGLRELRTLSISWDQIPALRKAGKLPFLKELTIDFPSKFDAGWAPLESLEALPEMPELQTLDGLKTRSLAGLQRFTKLRNLEVDFGENEVPLAPLDSIAGTLTHLSLSGEKLADAGPLAKLGELRSLFLRTEAEQLKLEALEKLPRLHEANIYRASKKVPEAATLQAKLSSWDIEFEAKPARHQPALTLVTVDEKEFKAIDNKAPQGTRNPDGNLNLLRSELWWLTDKIQPASFAKLTEDEDYAIPYSMWHQCRWRDLILHTPKADRALPRIVSGIQKALCEAKNDWIVHLESESGFKLWVYPDKLVLPREHEATVKRLLGK